MNPFEQLIRKLVRFQERDLPDDGMCRDDLMLLEARLNVWGKDYVSQVMISFRAMAHHRAEMMEQAKEQCIQNLVQHINEALEQGTFWR